MNRVYLQLAFQRLKILELMLSQDFISCLAVSRGSNAISIAGMVIVVEPIQIRPLRFLFHNRHMEHATHECLMQFRFFTIYRW